MSPPFVPPDSATEEVCLLENRILAALIRASRRPLTRSSSTGYIRASVSSAPASSTATALCQLGRETKGLLRRAAARVAGARVPAAPCPHGHPFRRGLASRRGEARVRPEDTEALSDLDSSIARA